MPELNLGPPPSRSPSQAIIIALALIIAATAAVLFFDRRGTTDVTVTRVQIYAPRTESKAVQGSIHIVGAPAHFDSDLYVLLTVKLTDKQRLPLFIKDETAILTAPDHSIAEASAIEAPDLANLYTTFPELEKLASPPLARDTKIAPDQSVEGLVLLHFPGATQENWASRQSATLTLDFFHQSPSQTITIP